MTIMEGVHFRIRENQLRDEALDVALKLNHLASEAFEAGDRTGALRAMTIANAIHLAVNFGKEEILSKEG